MSSQLDDPNLLRGLVRQAKSSHSSQGRALDTALAHQKHLGGDCLAPSAMSTRRRSQQQQLQTQRNISAAWEASAAARTQCGADGFAAGSTAAAGGTVAPTSLKSSTKSEAHASAVQAKSASPGSTAGTHAATSTGLHHSESGGVLQVPTLATVAPSFTKAADEGVEALGGTKIQGPGYTCMIGLVPTTDTVQCIDDDYELISSMRPYRYDAKRHAQQVALREASAPPHPDLLRQLEPTLTSLCPSDLIDVGGLPREYLLAVLQQQQQCVGSTEPTSAEAELGATADAAGATQGVEPVTALGGTYPFICQGRPEPSQRPRLPGHRQPSLGQYNPRYAVIEPRTVGGYMMPKDSAAPIPRGRLQATGDGETAADGHRRDLSGGADQSCASLEAAVATHASGTLRAANSTVASREGLGATLFNKSYAASEYAQGLNTIAGKNAERHAEGDGSAEVQAHKPGENIKGSSMFLSKTERKMERGTAAPDVVYWPYPDARSNVKRAPCGVQYDVPSNVRRRQPPVSGVPSAVYDVCEDIAANPHRVVDMQSTTSRRAHWYGKKWGTERASRAEQRHTIAHSSDFADVDAALRATRPAEKAATLPPRVEPAVDEKLHRHREAQQQENTVSVEMNLSYPPPLIGGAQKLAKVRDFAHMPGRSQREGEGKAVDGGGSAYHLAGPYDDGTRTLDDALALTEKRARTAHIRLGAPGHAALVNTTTPTELGEVPNLKWVKPNTERTTTFAKGSNRPDHLLPFHDLTYETAKSYAAVEPRVKGDPAIGTVMTRQRREKIFATHGCAPQHVLAYDNLDLPQKVKSVPQFEKQITKETQFVGHRIQSERWERRNPKAPGPGYYTVSYNAVE